MWKTAFIVIYLCVIVQGDDSLTKIIKLRQGTVRGYKDPDGDIFTFYGIPYAKAPTGKYRFKPPLPPPIWIDTLDAVDNGIICPQSNIFNNYPKNAQMQEDCLIANLYVPNTKKRNLPVIVYIHGGAYLAGYGNMGGYKNLVKSKELIAVTFNYRLGAHGFLCLGTKDVPGNAGMKDQLALLRWLNENIANVGGNPKDVTIAGYSAGSSSVDLLMLSKSTEGLFNKIIPESGANIAAFSLQTDPIANAEEYAKSINFTDVDNFYALEEFYKTVPYEILHSTVNILKFDNTFLVSPCVEPLTNDEPFLTDSPVNILKSGNYKKLPMLYGFAHMEGLFRLDIFDEWKEDMNKDFSLFIPADLYFKDMEEKKLVANKIKQFYFGDDVISNESILNYINFFTDVVFAYPTLRSTRLQVEAGNNNVYLYEYSFVHEDTPIVPHTNVRGAFHCAQTDAIMDGSSFKITNESLLSQDYQDFKHLMRQIWTNFIKTGKPIPEGSELPDWPPVSKDWSPHMVLDQPIRLKGSLLKDRALFWEEIYEKYYRHPSPPSPPSRPSRPSIHNEL